MRKKNKFSHLKVNWLIIATLSIVFLVAIGVMTSLRVGMNPVELANVIISGQKENLDIEAVSVPVTGEGQVELVCGATSILQLPSGGSVRVPQLAPCGLKATVTAVHEDELPSKLPAGIEYKDATAVNVIKDGGAIEILPDERKMVIWFANDANMIGKDFLGVLHWEEDGGWQEVTFDNRLRATSNQTGLFVLVKR